jgi:uncharacterized damage-inducible protein DinB
MSHSLQYPIGEWVLPSSLSSSERARAIRAIGDLPALLGGTLSRLSAGDLAARYRPGGWTLRQVVHHLADSHLNGYTRFKLALTEDEPTIKPYDQDAWATLADGDSDDLSATMELLSGLHRRWHRLLVSLDDARFARRLVHPQLGVLRLDQVLTNYAWHGAHHVAQIAAWADRTARALPAGR